MHEANIRERASIISTFRQRTLEKWRDSFRTVVLLDSRYVVHVFRR